LDPPLRFLAWRLAWLPAPRVILLALFNAILLFELWILLPRIISFGPAAPSYYLSCGFCSLKLFPLGQQRRFTIRVVDFAPSSYLLWASSAVLLFKLWTPVPRIISFRPAAPLSYSSSRFQSHGSFLSGLQHTPVLPGLQYLFSIIQGHFHSLPRLCIRAISAITMTNYGHQSPDFLSFGAWYVSNVSIIFDAPCLFLHHLPYVSLNFVAFLCDFRN
jgi:hypothetical protein